MRLGRNVPAEAEGDRGMTTERTEQTKRPAAGGGAGATERGRDRRLAIVLVDDHPAVREGVRRLVGRFPQMAVVGEAGSGGEGMARVAQVRPDIAVMDIGLPDMSGVEVTARLQELAPETKVIIYSVYGEVETVREALVAGARGYVVKGSSLLELARAIKTAAAGGLHLPESVMPQLQDWLRGAAGGEGRQTGGVLSAREEEVLALVAGGWPSREIAARLSISQRTVEHHRSHLLQKLGRDSTAGLVRYGLDHGLVEPR